MHGSYANPMTALSKGFEHPQNLVSVEAPGTNTPWILRDNGVVLIDIKMKRGMVKSRRKKKIRVLTQLKSDFQSLPLFPNLGEQDVY